jgi:ketosteroid isomerase-like protein
MSVPLAVVQEFYHALGAGQIERVVALLSRDLEWEEAEGFPYYGGIWRDPRAVVENLFIPLARDWEGFSATPFKFLCKDENVVCFGRYTGKFRATGRGVSVPFAHCWRVREDRITQFKQYTDTAKIREAVAKTSRISTNGQEVGACESPVMQEFGDMPIACRLTTEEFRMREATLLTQFRSAVQSTEELSDGYAFRIPGDAEWIAVAAELIAAERECCSFLKFEFEANPQMGPVIVRVTGPVGTKGFVTKVFIRA